MFLFVKRCSRLTFFFWISIGFLTFSCQKKVVEVDLLIKGALVFSGENEPPKKLAVGICEERICYVGTGQDVELVAGEIIEAEGLFLTPGFIDPHTHLDRDLSSSDQNAVLSALRQGVTTVISGNDGGRKAFRERLESREIRPRLLLEVKDNIRKRGGGEALVFSETNNPALDGFSLAEFANARLLPEPEAVLVLLNEQDNVGVISYNMKEDDLKNFMLQPWVVTGSDASSGHPRKFGSFARKISHYAGELRWMEMQTAIYQSSGHTAEIFRIPDRGFIKAGHYADLVLFDPGKFKEMASFDKPYEEASGVDFLFINGEKIINKGSFTGELAGKVLRKEIQAE